MSQRKAVIEAYRAVMKESWHTGDFATAAAANEAIGKYETMGDQEFNDRFLDGEEVVEIGEQ